ncbi:hypothetical protein Ptr86124_007046 [Pyrenophora tritici-repentis]|uniref:Uncharacterized protein n=1 Tax=Pyrenophora tritici-repentis TaxID=45151 RepID=A0A922NED7_9PLEO|nr:hypothetical protein Ptr86124_007046 [Pyrenophora tritici-repentis]
MVLSYIHRSYASPQSPNWAGKKVVFYGGHSELTDEFRHHYDVRTQHRSEYRFSREVLKEWEWDRYPNPPEDRWGAAVDGGASWYPTRFLDDLDLAKRVLVYKDLSQMYMYPQNRVWILRNNTTKEYIRSDQLQRPADMDKGWELSVPSPEPVTYHFPQDFQTSTYYQNHTLSTFPHPQNKPSTTFKPAPRRLHTTQWTPIPQPSFAIGSTNATPISVLSPNKRAPWPDAHGQKPPQPQPQPPSPPPHPQQTGVLTKKKITKTKTKHAERLLCRKRLALKKKLEKGRDGVVSFKQRQQVKQLSELLPGR